MLGSWRVEPRRQRIVQADVSRSLDPRLMDVLVVLAVAGGEVVTRDELLDAVWKETYVSENSLSQAVSRLRRALDDDPRDPRYVETISGSGYRLVAAVEAAPRVADGGAMPNPTTPELGSDRRLASKRWIGGFAAIVSLMIALYLLAGRPKPTPAPLSARPEVTVAGNQFEPRLSPDGDYVVFAWDGGNADASSDLWLQAIGADYPVRLTDDERHDRAPSWSPDGERVAFARFSSETGQCGIFVTGIIGGRAERVADCVRGLRSLDWSPRGDALVHNGAEEEGASGLFLVDLETGKRRALTSAPAGARGDVGPRFSPDGDWIAFERELGAEREEIGVVSVDGADLRLLTDEGGRVRGLDWSADGESVLFSSNRSGQFALWSVAAVGGEASRLSIADTWVTQPSVARSGHRLIYRTFRDSVNLWELRLPAEPSTLEPRRLFASSRSERQPAWAPDGVGVAFLSDRAGSLELWSGGREGGPLMRHTDFGGPQLRSPVWSPDGRRIVFDAAVAGPSALWAVERESRGAERLIESGSSERNATFSRDGQWMYFTSDRDGGHDLWRMPAAGGPATRVTVGGGFLGQESLDGTRLFYTRLDAPGIWETAPNGGLSTRVVERLDPADWGNWVVGAEAIHFVARGPTRLERWDLDTGEVTTALPLPSPVPYMARGLALSPDGRSLLISQIDQSDDEIMTVELSAADG